MHKERQARLLSLGRPRLEEGSGGASISPVERGRGLPRARRSAPSIARPSWLIKPIYRSPRGRRRLAGAPAGGVYVHQFEMVFLGDVNTA